MYIYEMMASLFNNVQNNNYETEDQASTETDTDLDNIVYTDLYVVGKIWIDALKTCLIGANFNLFPIVKATKVDETPKKPPYMKFKDLSLYKSPHSAYKEYIGDKIKCPDANVKLLHRSLLPHVKDGRQKFSKSLSKVLCYTECYAHNAVEDIIHYKNDFKQTMRDPDNLAMRQAVVACGGLAGYLFSRFGGIPRKLIFISAGLLSTGALCFPKETDVTFRNAVFVAVKSFIALYNKWGGREIKLREKLACRDELPKPLPKRQPLKCPPK